MALFVLHKLILQTCMCSHPLGLDVWFLVGPFVYFHTSCVRTAKVLARLRICAGSAESSLVAYAISTIISWAGSNILFFLTPAQIFFPLKLLITLFAIPSACFECIAVWSSCVSKVWHYLSRFMTKPTKWHVRPAKTQISLGIRPVWSESSLCAPWVAKDPSFLHADSEDSDQTGRMPRLIWVFAGRTCHFVGFVMRRLKFS